MQDHSSTGHPSPSDSASRTWHLRISYDGTDFHGWQIQPNVRTVQGDIQARLRRLLAQPDLRTTGTSRTDAGVHALDQHVSFECPTPSAFDAGRLRMVLNRWLPADVAILDVEEAESGFSVRFDCVGKAYTYCLFLGEKPSPLISRYVWHLPRPLDLEAMAAAAAQMTGEHDFASFAANAKRDLVSTVRQVLDVRLDSLGELLCITVVGRSFLYKMVRTMVGYLVHVGLGKSGPADVGRVLRERNRCAAAESAPAAGLFLCKVFFDESEMQGYEPVIPPFRWIP